MTVAAPIHVVAFFRKQISNKAHSPENLRPLRAYLLMLICLISIRLAGGQTGPLRQMAHCLLNTPKSMSHNLKRCVMLNSKSTGLVYKIGVFGAHKGQRLVVGIDTQS